MRGASVAIGFAVMGAPASAMPVSTFLSKIEGLDPNGPTDQLGPQVSELRSELQRDAAELRAERLAASSAGKKPPYCPPTGATQPGAEEIIAALEEIPPASRANLEVKDAIRAYLSVRFPC